MPPIQPLRLAAVAFLLTAGLPLLPAPNFPLPAVAQTMRDSPTEMLRQRKAEESSVKSVNGSHHHNMKELRFDAMDGVWRVAFAFDPERRAILFVAGDKSGISQKQFYKKLIRKADERFDQHLEQLRKK